LLEERRDVKNSRELRRTAKEKNPLKHTRKRSEKLGAADSWSAIAVKAKKKKNSEAGGGNLIVKAAERGEEGKK